MSNHEEIRRRYKKLALADAIRKAADGLGIPAEVASVYFHRFDCEIEKDGLVRVRPNPTEFLLSELKSDPLLQESVLRARQARQEESSNG